MDTNTFPPRLPLERPDFPRTRPVVAAFIPTGAEPYHDNAGRWYIHLRPAVLGEPTQGSGWWIERGHLPASGDNTGEHWHDWNHAATDFWHQVNEAAAHPLWVLESLRSGMPGALRDLL